jgi:hypothetical protein
MSQVSKVVLVGHCGYDASQLHKTVQSALPELPIESANETGELQQHAASDALLLVNRKLDPGLGTDNGIELIKELADDGDAPRLMLISNFAEAQSEAQAAGALPGFGKGGLGSETATERLKAAVE